MQDIQSNGGSPMRMFIQRTRPYLDEEKILALKPDRSLTQARDQQGAVLVFNWVWEISNVLGFPMRTRCTAMVLYHRLRLFYADIEYNLVDVACAALFTASKIEDTLKKSLEILAVAHNIRHATSDPINSDSPLLEDQHKRIIGIERQILESCAFDFRARHFEKWVPKLSKAYNMSKEVGGHAWLICQDAYKTVTVLKMTPVELVLAALILAHQLLLHKQQKQQPEDAISSPLPQTIDPDYPYYKTTFANVLECVHDILDLYTDHLNNTEIGPKFGADAFIQVRIELNRQAKAHDIPPNNNALPFSYVNGYMNGDKEDELNNTANQIRGGGGGGSSGGGQGVTLNERSITGTVRFVFNREREEEENRALEEMQANA